MSRAAKNLLFGILLASPVLYVASCSYTSNARERAFDSIEVGDGQEAVAKKFKSAYVREEAGAPAFLRYASRACLAPCSERWWFENRMAFDTEAWSIEFGSDKRVLRKVRWASP